MPQRKSSFKRRNWNICEIFPHYFPFFFPRQNFGKINLILQSIAVMMGLHFPEENVSPNGFVQPDS